MPSNKAIIYPYMKLSVTIITLNEAANIERCIKSVSFADEVIVVDSNSSDGTIEMAESLGAKVYQNAFVGYGQQKNYAASKTNGEWIFNLDADEEVDEKLKKSILKTIENSKAKPCYQVQRLTKYGKRWIYHGGWYPNTIRRLCKRDLARWTEPQVHEDLIPLDDSDAPVLKGHLLHYSFPTISSQVQTNIKYAQLGAKDLIGRKGRPSLLAVLIRPFGKFLECYLVKKGFLDGIEGFIIAINAAHSMFMKYAIAYGESEGN